MEAALRDALLPPGTPEATRALFEKMKTAFLGAVRVDTRADGLVRATLDVTAFMKTAGDSLNAFRDYVLSGKMFSNTEANGDRSSDWFDAKNLGQGFMSIPSEKLPGDVKESANGPKVSSEQVKEAMRKINDLDAARDKAERADDGTLKTLKPIIDALEAEVSEIDNNSLLVKAGLISDIEVDELRQRGKEKVQEYNTLIKAGVGPDANRSEVLVKLKGYSKTIAAQLEDVISRSKSEIKGAMDDYAKSGWFGGFNTWLTGNDVHAMIAKNAQSTINRMEYVRETFLKQADSELGKPAANTAKVADLLRGVAGNIRSVSKFDLMEDAFASQEQGLVASRNAAIGVALAVPLAFATVATGGQTLTFGGAILHGAASGAAVGFGDSLVRNLDDVNANKKSIGEAGQEIVLDTGKGALIGGALGGAFKGIGMGITRLRMRGSNAPQPTAAPEAPAGSPPPGPTAAPKPAPVPEPSATPNPSAGPRTGRSAGTYEKPAAGSQGPKVKPEQSKAGPKTEQPGDTGPKAKAEGGAKKPDAKAEQPTDGPKTKPENPKPGAAQENAAPKGRLDAAKEQIKNQLKNLPEDMDHIREQLERTQAKLKNPSKYTKTELKNLKSEAKELSNLLGKRQFLEYSLRDLELQGNTALSAGEKLKSRIALLEERMKNVSDLEYSSSMRRKLNTLTTELENAKTVPPPGPKPGAQGGRKAGSYEKPNAGGRANPDANGPKARTESGKSKTNTGPKDEPKDSSQKTDNPNKNTAGRKPDAPEKPKVKPDAPRAFDHVTETAQDSMRLNDFLGVAPDASGDVIKSAAKKLAAKLHPDALNRSGGATLSSDRNFRVAAAVVDSFKQNKSVSPTMTIAQAKKFLKL